MAKNLIIVESPAKAKTLKKFLGSRYKIEASMGHVRDLPKSTLGIDVENDYEPKYITIRGKGDLLANLRKEARKSEKIYLATDPDREGEAISWHLLHALNLTDEQKKNTYRITFNQITKEAVRQSLKNPRDIDMDLVDAQQARRTLDRVVGYKMSPILWKKVKKGLSAGRVQSVLLKIIYDREEEIEVFEKEEYWSIDCILSSGKKSFVAKLNSDENGNLELSNIKIVDPIIKTLEKSKFIIEEIKKGTRKRNPKAPFTTSTLQQESSKLLGYSTSKTMQIAQQLYEGVDIKGEGSTGLVTYIRTDSFRIADEAFDELNDFILKNYGKEYSNKEKREYKSKNKSQDAHEAIRPTNVNRKPEDIKSSLSRDQFRLYKLIWERLIASQMTSALYETVRVNIKADKYNLRSSGSILKFNGYLIVYDKNEDKEEDILMPDLKEKEILKLKEVIGNQHFTQPPPRFTEAMIIKTLEELGIGRPSTYSPTISTVLARGYVVKEDKSFYPTELGEIVNNMISNNFKEVINVDFTANMEAELDKVEDGELFWKEILRGFYPGFQKKVIEAEENIEEVEIEDEVTDVICDKCGKNMVIKMSKYGKFLACPGFPDCRNTKSYFEKANVKCPKCDGEIMIKKTKKGRKYFGCENFPECDFMSWSKPAGKNCPKCEEYLVIKGVKNPKFMCSNKECTYTEEIIEAE